MSVDNVNNESHTGPSFNAPQEHDMHIKAFIDRYTLTWYTINTSNKNEVLDCGRGNDVGRCQTQVMQSVQRNGEYNCELVTFDSSYGETA